MNYHILLNNIIKMSDFYVKNTGYIVKCPECLEIIKFDINYESFCVSVECRNGHNKKDIPFQIFHKEVRFLSLF